MSQRARDQWCVVTREEVEEEEEAGVSTTPPLNHHTQRAKTLMIVFGVKSIKSTAKAR